MIASAVPNKKLEMVLQYNPLHKEFVTFNLQSHSEGTSLSLTRKSTGPFSFLSVWGFDSKKSKILDNLGYLIPEADITEQKVSDQSTDKHDTSDNLFEDRNQMAAYLVNKTLDGDNNIIKSTSDVYARGKAKALLIKINKGTAERPAMPDSSSSSANNGDDSLETQLDNSTKEIINKESEGDLIERLVSEGIKGNMEEINSLENKVLRGKIKAAIVKAKRP